MQIVKEGTYKILTSEGSILEQLRNIEIAARTCYNSFNKRPDVPIDYDFLKKLLFVKKHESVFEHSLITVSFDNCSRGFTHELVRHRHCAFSQQSTRYVEHDAKYVVNTMVNGLPSDAVFSVQEISEIFLSFFEQIYKTAIDHRKMKKEDARQFLPIAIVSPIVISTNIREWRHIFKLRTDTNAHWEIRRVMVALLEDLKKIVPVVFEDL